jgi:perosamine synthetase
VIPVNEPRLGEQELKYVTECVNSGWISSEGRFLEAFESEWARYCGRKFGVAVCNGTVALELAVASLKLGANDEVILPTFTIISCLQAVLYAGAKPVLVDADARTWCMDVKQVAQKITSRTRAIMPVHIYGHPVDMDPLLELANKNHLAIVEDAAETHGATYKGRRCGSFGEVSCFSFYANKIVTTGEGGMILTDDDSYNSHLRSLRNLCFQKERRFYHTELGHNYRMTNLQAAIGLAQIEHIEKAIAHKRWMGAAYNARLSHLNGIQLPVEEPWATNVYWMYGIVIDERLEVTAAEFSNRLTRRGIMTRPFFLGMHEQPVLRDAGWFPGESYPVAELLARQGLYLPSGLALTQDQLDEVCRAVEDEWKILQH